MWKQYLIHCFAQLILAVFTLDKPINNLCLLFSTVNIKLLVCLFVCCVLSWWWNAKRVLRIPVHVVIDSDRKLFTGPFRRFNHNRAVINLNTICEMLFNQWLVHLLKPSEVIFDDAPFILPIEQLELRRVIVRYWNNRLIKLMLCLCISTRKGSKC